MKKAPELLLTATAVYQMTENQRLENNIKELKDKLVKVTSLQSKIEQTEFEGLGKQLNNVAEEEKSIKMDLDITTYATTIQALIGAQNEKLNEIEKVHPTKEFNEYIERLKTTTARVPAITTDELFQRKITHLVDGIVTVDYAIPMVKSNSFVYYSFITIPDEDGNSIDLGNQQPVANWAIGVDNKTAFPIDGARRTSNNIYDAVQITKTPACIAAIMRDEPASECKTITRTEDSPQIFPLREDILVAIPDKTLNITVSCDEHAQSIITRPSIIKFTDCFVSDGITTWMTSQRGRATRSSRATQVANLALSPPQLEISTYHQDVRLKEWRKELQEELDHSDNWLSSGHSKYWMIGAIAMAALMFLAPILKLCLPRRPREENHNESTTQASADTAATRWSLEYLASLNKLEI